MKFIVSGHRETSDNYEYGAWPDSNVYEANDRYCLYQVNTSPQDFESAARALARPNWHVRLLAWVWQYALVPYVAIWREGRICMDVEIGAVSIGQTVDVLFVGLAEQVRPGDFIQLVRFAPRKNTMPIREIAFLKSDRLPPDTQWATEWFRDIRSTS